MNTATTWLMVFFAGGSLLLILACTVPAQGHEDTNVSEHCAEDITGDGYLSTPDIVELTGRFGQVASLPYDISPELMPDGFISVADIALVTNHFGEGCIGSTGADSQMALIPGGVWDCTFKVSGFIWGPMGNYSLSHDWGGKTVCKSDGGQYLSMCIFNWEWQDANGWHLVATTDDYYFDGVYCIAQGINAWLPHYTPLRGSIYHWIKRSDGSFAHAPMYHAESVTHHIP